jgi:RNA polymerase sigma-70 factor, ECF subfamily
MFSKIGALNELPESLRALHSAVDLARSCNGDVRCSELSSRILRALQRLTPHERMVFDLRHFHGMKLRAVSEILNISVGSVKTSLVRATRKLRLHLAKC